MKIKVTLHKDKGYFKLRKRLLYMKIKVTLHKEKLTLNKDKGYFKSS
jgi:hypothetical protein